MNKWRYSYLEDYIRRPISPAYFKHGSLYYSDDEAGRRHFAYRVKRGEDVIYIDDSHVARFLALKSKEDMALITTVADREWYKVLGEYTVAETVKGYPETVVKIDINAACDMYMDAPSGEMTKFENVRNGDLVLLAPPGCVIPRAYMKAADTMFIEVSIVDRGSALYRTKDSAPTLYRLASWVKLKLPARSTAEEQLAKQMKQVSAAQFTATYTERDGCGA